MYTSINSQKTEFAIIRPVDTTVALHIFPFTRGYFKSIWTVLYHLWAHKIWVPKLGKPGKTNFVKVNIDNLSFLPYQRSVHFLYEKLDMLVEALTAFTVRQS